MRWNLIKYIQFDGFINDVMFYCGEYVSRTVNQLIMRVHKPKVEYKLALQLDPREHLDILYNIGTLNVHELFQCNFNASV